MAFGLQQTNLGEWNSLLPRVQANLAPDPLLDVDAGRLSVCRPDPPDPWQVCIDLVVFTTYCYMRMYGMYVCMCMRMYVR